MGRALTVTEDGVASNRLYDGIQVVAEGDTQLTLALNGQTLSETTTTTTVKGNKTTTTVTSVDVLTDVLGSAVATASNGVISADLALYGDFGDPLTTPKVDTVTGFTGKIDTAGLVEFAARTYDPATRQWVQDDRYRGTVTRASSMNRYAYVEGAPETFVDELGFYRARAAIRAQALAAWEAAYAAALAAYEKAVQIAYKEAVSYQQTCGKYGCVKADIEVRGHYGFVNTADAVYGQYGYISAQSIVAQKKLELQERLEREARAKSGMGPGGGQCSDQACVEAHLKSLGMDDGYSQSSSYIPPPPLEDGFVKYDGTVCAVGSACYDNYVKYPHNPAADEAIKGAFAMTGWGLANVGIGILNTPSTIVNSFGCFYEITCDKYQTPWGEVTVSNEAAWGTIDAVGPSEYKWWQVDRGTDVGVLLIMVGTAKAGEKWSRAATVSEARAAQLQADLSAQSRGVSARLAEQAQISHGHISAIPKGPLETGSYFKSIDDAKAVLAAYQAGDAEIVGLSSGGDMVVVRVPSVTGYNQNVGSGYLNQPTDTFLIKGTTKVSVVPTTPGGPSDMSLVFIDVSTLAALAAQANVA